MAGGLLDIGEMMMKAAQRRLETSSQNVANISTPGYKARATFQETLRAADVVHAPGAQTHLRETQGALRRTEQPLDLAVSGDGYFLVRGDVGAALTRNGQFTRAADGRIVDAQGRALQTADGVDLVLSAAAPAILEDGVVLENEAPVARIGIFARPADIDVDTPLPRDLAPPDIANGRLRQGMLEASTVALATEMTSVMTILRQSEAGARVVQIYDGLMGQAISAFSRGGK